MITINQLIEHKRRENINSIQQYNTYIERLEGDISMKSNELSSLIEIRNKFIDENECLEEMLKDIENPPVS